jgi:hypothetical protein
MAINGSEDIWQCMGWDGNEEPCPGKMPVAMGYCGKCDSVKMKFREGGDPHLCYFACKEFKKVLKQKGKRLLKCEACLQRTRLNVIDENR